MLSYLDHHWALIPGSSCFKVYIPGGARATVHWSLQLDFRAVGPDWRRVHHNNRPSLSIDVSSFDIAPPWTNLARTNFWNVEPAPAPAPGAPFFFPRPPAGELFFTSRFPPEDMKHSHRGWVHWRVIEQKDGLFLIELAADPDGGSPPEPIVEESLVLSDGTEESRHQRDDQSMKDHASIYLVEWVPFGAITVRTPPNADPLTHAHARVRQFLGITREPEYIQVSDYTDRPEMEDNPMSYEPFVKLYYHGYYDGV